MAKVRWKFDIAGFAALRNHPRLVGSMRSAADAAAGGTPFDVEVVTWPHAGRKEGPRTSVQIWANTYEARRRVNENPGELTAALGRARPS